MASFESVNYSLRPSKNIQRQLVFEGVGHLQAELPLDSLTYVGFGSIWFTDFVMAHKQLDAQRMISIEGNEVGYKRAVFNAPYSTVRVEHGLSSAVVPKLLVEDDLRTNPWMVWLDFDYVLDESVVEEIRTLLERAPVNSLMLITFDGRDQRYGRFADRPDRIREILGAVVPDNLAREQCEAQAMQETLADLTLDFMTSVAAEIARPGGFVPCFRLIYEDTVPMVTVGGVLPSKGALSAVLKTTRATDWPCRPPQRIRAPLLTMRETATLQSRLPQDMPITRDDVRKLGFDLEEEQIRAFQTYYRQYPSFAQIIA